MENNSEIKLKNILSKATEKIAGHFPEVQEYLCEIAEDKLQTLLTPKQTRLVTRKLLEKIGFQVNNQ